MKWITLPLEEYKDHVLEIRAAKADRESFNSMSQDLNRTLYLLLNELHAKYDLAEFVTLANDKQDRVRFDISGGIVKLKFVNDADSDTEDEEPDEDPFGMLERVLKSHE